MATDGKKLQPIIVKKIKKGGHAVHGGAWKIAYADFVTAMMAFFLLMWLLGSTSEGDKKGIADYFQSPLKVALMGGGSGAGDASSVIKGGGTDLSRQGGQVKKGDIEAERKTYNLRALKAEQRKAEQARLSELKEKMADVIANSPKLAEFKSQVRLDMTREGLRIQIVDDQKRPMFDSGSADVQPYMREILRAIGSVLTEVPNRLTLEGHTDAKPMGSGLGYSNWELSSDRANASRRELLAGGLDDARILRVQGLSASVPFEKQDPFDPINRRISIIVMTRDAVDRFFQGGDAPVTEEPTDAASAEAQASSPPTSHR